ncbi:hypothetical protein [Ramlibacter sp.]|uniref:hypothetical protein n=1 Tax=Ramlibacter sp. TaxID=1917967 RepID=UPI00260F4A4C|nr:hypothetical protein [Ramlibacter sp.]MDB5957947.1 hypothetical protein [Ramlibacter sp.]
MTGQRTVHALRSRAQRLLSVGAAVTRTWRLLGACTRVAAGSGSKFDHAFKFDLVASAFAYGTPDAELLDYEYGSAAGSSVRASRQAVKREKVTDRVFLYQYMPAGEYLHVRWRELPSRAVHEDRVDLRPMLPRNMTGHCVYFEVVDAQLFVYLFPPPYAYAPVRRVTGSPYAAKYQIYPPVRE